MNQKLPLLIGGFVFAIVAILHFLRVYYSVTIFIGGEEIANWVSWVAGVVAAALAFWLWRTAKYL